MQSEEMWFLSTLAILSGEVFTVDSMNGDFEWGSFYCRLNEWGLRIPTVYKWTESLSKKRHNKDMKLGV